MGVRHALLALLADGPKHGQRLREEFEARTGDAWPLNAGQVYTTVQRLIRDGLVERDAVARGRKAFRITDAGRAELDAWLTTPPGEAAPPRDELVMKVLLVLGVPGVDVRAVIRTHRRRLEQVVGQYARLRAEVEDDVRVALVVDAELLRLDGVIRWLDTAEARLEPWPEDLAPTEDVPALRLRRRVGARL